MEDVFRHGTKESSRPIAPRPRVPTTIESAPSASAAATIDSQVSGPHEERDVDPGGASSHDELLRRRLTAIADLIAQPGSLALLPQLTRVDDAHDEQVGSLRPASANAQSVATSDALVRSVARRMRRIAPGRARRPSAR